VDIGTPFSTLQNVIIKIFNFHTPDDIHHLQIYYKDDEIDMVLISSDNELGETIYLMQQTHLPVLRLIVHLKNQSPSPSSIPEASAVQSTTTLYHSSPLIFPALTESTFVVEHKPPPGDPLPAANVEPARTNTENPELAAKADDLSIDDFVLINRPPTPTPAAVSRKKSLFSFSSRKNNNDTNRFNEQLKKLEEMGWNDKGLCLKALRKRNGDISGAVEVLLAQPHL